MITPADIENKEFSRGVRGYKEDEVDDFLDLIIIDMEKLIKENRQLKKELEKAQGQVTQNVATESSVYETLEAAKSLMNDIAASAERRAEVLLKDAELEAALITREAKESISRLTDEGNRLRTNVERLREKYRHMLELELERVDSVGSDLLAEFAQDFLPASIADLAEEEEQDPEKNADMQEPQAEKTDSGDEVQGEKKEITKTRQDLSKTVVNIRR